ncbi:MAG: hypothetical protein ACRCUM_00065 [Mycoplasmoidaceae bacterium]
MSRFNSNIGKESAKSLLGSYGSDHAVKLGKPIRIYKFRKLSGIIRITPQGEQSLRTDPAFFSQLVNVYTSKEPVVVLWEGSTRVALKKETDELVKYTSVGKYYDLYNNSSFDVENQNSKITFLTNEYVIQTLNKSVELTSYDWIPEDVDITDYVYLILDKRAQSYQWLEIMNISPNWNEETKQIEKVNISFENVGLKYAESGKNILDFFQFGAIGEGYAFPEEKWDEENETLITKVNSSYIRDYGLTSIQFDYMSCAGDSSFAIYGREIGDIDENGNQILDKPYRLFLHQELFPFSSNVFFNKPNSNSFMVENVKPTVSGIWKSYKQNPNASLGGYNILENKEVLCGFEMSKDDVEASNPIVDNSYSFENWDTTSFFEMKGEYDFSSVPGIKSVKEWGGARYGYTMFLNFNSYVNFSSDVFNFENKETKKYKLTDTLGVIGGLVDIIIGGLDIGWTSSNSKAPNQPMNLRIPCIAYLNGMSALEENAPLPCDVFLDDKGKQVIPVNTNVMTSHRFSLTNLIQDSSQVRDDAIIGKGKDGVWNTKYIGQTKFEDGTFINDDESEFKWNPPTTKTLSAGIGKKWIIDAVETHVIANSDVRLTAYVEDDFAKPISIYQSLFTTLSKAINDIRLWGTTMKFNYYDEFNTEGDRVKWPEMVLPPLPEFDKSPIVCEERNFVSEEITCKYVVASQPEEIFIETAYGETGSSSNLIVWNRRGANGTDNTFTVSTNFDIKEYNYIAKSPKNRKINTMEEIDYVEINYKIMFNDGFVKVNMYAPIIFIDENEGVVSNDALVQTKQLVNLEEETVYIDVRGVDGKVSTLEVGKIKPLDIGNKKFFDFNTIKLTRNPQTKTIEVSWTPKAQNIDMTNQFKYSGLASTLRCYVFKRGEPFDKYTTELVSVILHLKKDV